MGDNEPIRCRIVACRKDPAGLTSWDFYLINDNAEPLDSAVLYAVGCEWGDNGSTEDTDVRVAGLAPGAHAILWQDDGSGAEMRMDLSLRVRLGEREAKLVFEFPKLYLKKGLPLVAGLDKPGWAVSAEG